MIPKSTKQFKKIVVKTKEEYELEKLAHDAAAAEVPVPVLDIPSIVKEILGRDLPVVAQGFPPAQPIAPAQPFVVPTTVPITTTLGAPAPAPVVARPTAPKCNIAKHTYYNHGTRPGTYKQWSIWVKDNAVVTEWGPYLGTLQRNSKQYAFEWQAQLCYEKILSAKIKKGYMKTIMDLSEY